MNLREKVEKALDGNKHMKEKMLEQLMKAKTETEIHIYLREYAQYSYAVKLLSRLLGNSDEE